MENTIVKFENEAKELKKCLIQAAIENKVDCIDPESEDARAMITIMRFVDAACQLVVEQSKTINEINSKFDKLLETIESGV